MPPLGPPLISGAEETVQIDGIGCDAMSHSTLDGEALINRSLGDGVAFDSERGFTFH